VGEVGLGTQGGAGGVDEEDVKNAISALGMTDAKVVLVPVNDSQDADAKKTSGTHWCVSNAGE